jgi:predicted  nucleic acid-binding Zn-ribbon protein
LESSDAQLRHFLANFETEKESFTQSESEMKGRINQLLAMLREAEDTAMREAVYHERVVSDLEKRLESANNRIEVLESQNVNGSEILFHAL